MAIFDLYSKRQRRLQGEMLDVYSYDSIPEKLRVQVFYIISGSIGEGSSPYTNLSGEAYKFIHETLRKEYGVMHLTSRPGTYKSDIMNFLLNEETTEKILDVIEVSFWYLNNKIKPNYYIYKSNTSASITPTEAIEELNERFKENGIGYAYQSEQIIRIDSSYAHAEITKPSLALLSNDKFEGANEEFLKAHEHYRHGRR